MGNETLAGGRARRTGGRIGRLCLGTSLTGAAAMLLAGAAPAAARPNVLSLAAPQVERQAAPLGPVLAPPQDLTIRKAAPIAASLPLLRLGAAIAARRESPASSRTPIHDPSVRPLDAAPGGRNVVVDVDTVRTRADGEHGIETFAKGRTQITAESVTTLGDAADGIHAIGYGDITIGMGEVVTKGDGSVGISAILNPAQDKANPDITVTAGTVTTWGDGSNGIEAVNYAPGGKTSVTVDQVTTHGNGSWGIYAGGFGDVTVDAGSIKTYGENAAGIVGISLEGDLTIKADTVDIAGAHGNAINATNLSQNGSTTIEVGTIATKGDNSVGIYVGGSNGYQGASHHVSVTAGSVSTEGDLAAGVVVLTGGDVDVNLGDVTVAGPRSRGIIVTTGEGDINLVAGNVVTKGEVALGRDAVGIALSDNGGNITADINSISTLGDHSPGILTNGYASNQSFTIREGITTAGYSSDGIFAFLDHGSLTIDSGAITTSGGLSRGVRAYSLSGDTDIRIGTLSTKGDLSSGVLVNAVSYDGEVHRVDLALGQVTTSGAEASGVVVLAQGGNVNVTTGSVTTSGADSAGIAIAAGQGTGPTGEAYGGDVTVAAVTVTTSGAGSNGIDIAAGGSTLITADAITTTGAGASAIHSVGDGPITIEVGSVSTTGDRADGIYAVTMSGDVGIKAQSVSATGFLSQGVRAASYAGDVNVEVGTVTGGVGTGIDARAGYGAHGNAVVTAGTILTNGAGIVALAGDDVTIAVDSVTTHSGTEDAGTQLGQAIKAVAHGGIDISAGTVATTGYWAEGVYAVATPSFNTGRAPGDITIDVGSVTTVGDRSTGVFAINTGYLDGGDQMVSITAGPVATAGDSASGLYGVGPNVTIAANGAVVTKGDRATGIYAAAIGGAAVVTAGAITTSGDLSSGVRAFGSGGTVDVTTTGPITTSGVNSYGVLAFGSADLTITNSGAIRTSGKFGRGLYAISSTGTATVTTSGAIRTTGEMAEAIRAISFAGGVDVTATGAIATTADYSAGILAARERTRGTDRAQDDAGDTPSVRVDAGTITTSGAHSNGITAVNYAFGGTTEVKVDSITTLGDSAAGIAAVTFGDLSIAARDVHASGVALYARTNGDYQTSLTVTGSVVSANNTAISLATSGGEGIVTVAKGAKVIGGGSRDPLYVGGGDAIFVSGGDGHSTVNNAGTIFTAAANGYAIEMIGSTDYYTGEPTSAITINNSGAIRGAVKLDVGADTINNSGTFVATKDSDFGGGGDRFINSGSLIIGTDTKPARIALLNLDSFTNVGGLIDLRNGVAGDELSLSGLYVGSNGARLGLDFAGGKADQLTIAGVAMGTTTIVLDGTGTGAGLISTPVTLVKAAGGSAADAFTLANPDVGLIHYTLRYDPASTSFGLTGVAGAPVYRLGQIQQGARAVWSRATDAWDAHLAQRRDTFGTGDDASGSRLWGQFDGGVETRDTARVVDGNPVSTGFRQDYYGAQLGLDLGARRTAKGSTLYGVTAGYLASKLNGRGHAARTAFDTLSFGAYAGVRSGVAFANVLGQYSQHWINASDATAGFSRSLRGESYGVTGQVGARFGRDRFYVEPVASLSYVRTALDDLDVLAQTVAFDLDEGTRGKLGARVGSIVDLGESRATFYLEGHYIHDFTSGAGLSLLSNGLTQDIAGVRTGDHGEATLGMTLFSGGRLSGFVEGSAEFGEIKGGGGRIGLSLKL